MYYTHEYSEKAFDDYDDCEDDLLANVDIEEYLNRLPRYERNIIYAFSRRKTNDEFCDWLEIVFCNLDREIAHEFITVHEEEKDETDWDVYRALNIFELNP